MEKWSIRPAPTTYDPLRHMLLVKGSMKDVSAVLQRFGALCGRPSPENSPEGFNYSLPLHGVTTTAMERLSAVLNEMSGASEKGGLAIRSLPQPGPLPLAVPAAKAATPPVETFIAPPVLAVPEPLSELVSLSPEIAAPPAAAEPSPSEPHAAGPSGAPEETGHAWGFQVRLDPLQTFDTLLVGPYNRFAHAAATSVVSAPGAMYNPLFLYGGAGVGKTHSLHAIARGLCAAMSDSVIMTSGWRLSNAVSLAVAAGSFGQLKEVLGKAKGLIVDDVHLIAVTEQNKSALAEVFGLFFSSNLQVVMSSIYPPRALGGLEEALKISLAKGWAVDLKASGQNVQIDIIHAWFDRQGFQLSTEDARAFHERLGPEYPEALVWMRRLVTLGKMPQFIGKNKPAELFNLLFDPGVAATDFPSAQELEATKDFSPPSVSGGLPLAIIVPKGHESMAGWVANAFYQAARQFKIDQGYRHVLLQAYDASQPFGVPFQIGEACQNASAKAALIVGPPNDTNLAGRLAEFHHAVTHVLESLDVACGWVHHRGTMAGSPFLRAHLDFLHKRR